MTVEITLNKEHYETFCALLRHGVYVEKQKQTLQKDFAPIILICIILAFVVAGRLTPSPFDMLLSGAAIGCVVFWISATVIAWIQNKGLKELIGPAEDDPLFNTTEYTFTDELLEAKSGSGGSHYPISKLKKYVVWGDLIMVFKSNREAYLFPKEQLSDAQIAFIEDWAAQHVPQATIPKELSA